MSSMIHAAVSWLALIVLLPIAPASAQRPDSVAGRGGELPAADSAIVKLEPIEVIASILSGSGPGVRSRIPARTAIVSGAEIRQRARLLPESLASQPGISTYDDLGSRYKTTLVSRGFTASPVVGLPQGVSVFVDGVPVNEPDAGQVNFDLLPLQHVRAVEVLSGTSALLGPNSLGGAVNLVTDDGDGPPSGEAEVTAGSHGLRSASASLGGAGRAWRFYTGGEYSGEDGWRSATAAKAYNWLISLGRHGDGRGAHLQAYAARAEAETAGSLPLSVYTVRPDSNFSAGDFEDLSQVHVAVSGYTPVLAGRAAGRVYFRGHGAERFNVNQSVDPDVRSFSRNRTLGASAEWSTWTVRGGGETGFRFGATGTLNRTRIRIFAERLDPGLTTHVESPIREAGVYGTADHGRGPVTLSGGLRLDAVQIPFRNRLDPERDTTSTFVRVSPRAGARMELGMGASLYASAGQSFRAPAVIELACADPHDPCPLPFALGDDPPLDPVIATTYETGLRWTRGSVDVGASVYRTGVRDDIFLFPYQEAGEPEGSTIDGYFANIARTRREGVELYARQELSGGPSLYVNYAFTRATFQVDGIELFSIREEVGGENEIERGDRLPLIPSHAARAGATVPLGPALRVGVDARYTGERWLRGDEANEEEPLDGFFVADARVTYEVGGWEIRANVGNVLDRRYAAFGTFNLNQGRGGVLERFLTPGEPRTLEIALRRRFRN